MLTQEERDEEIKAGFPDNVEGYVRPGNVPTDFPFDTDFPQFISRDKVIFTLTNLVLRQAFSNDKILMDFIDSINKNAETTREITISGDAKGTATFNQYSNIKLPITIDQTKMMPTGAILPFAGNATMPDGFLLCDGTEVSRKVYANLFAVIGEQYGTGDGSSTFALPNLIGQFLQGDNTAGTVKKAGLPNITGGTRPHGSMAFPGGNGWGSFYAKSDAGYPNGIGGGSSDNHYSIYFDASRSSSIYGNSDTVQPPTITMRYIIKY